MSLSKAFKKNEVKSVAKSMSDFNYDSKYAFYRFYREYYEFKEISLGSKYNRMKEFNELLIDFKSLKIKKIETKLKKDQIMKNVDELYKNYQNAYKSDFDTNDELTEDEKKKFEIDDIISKQSNLDEKTKELELTELPKWLRSENDFNEARKLINNIRADRNRVRSSSDDEKVFNDLNELINHIQNKKIERKGAIKKIGNIISNLDQQRQKKYCFSKQYD